MNRSGYSDDCEFLDLYRANVDRSIGGKRGQAFLRELAAALDAMPIRRLIAGELIDASGEVCAIGALCQVRKIDVSEVDYNDPSDVADAVGIATCLAAEVEWVNDDYTERNETPEQRWLRIRKWVDCKIAKQQETE